MVTSVPSAPSDDSANLPIQMRVRSGIVRFMVSVKRTPSCKRVGPIALLRHDQARKEGVDEVAKTDARTCA